MEGINLRDKYIEFFESKGHVRVPCVKGNKSQSGLGLSIVKKTVNILGYDITAENTDEGVRFVVK